jgi:hypothetical protein
MDKLLNYKAIVTKTSRRCPVCSATIQDNNYCLKVMTDIGRAIYIHDNEGACLEVHLVGLGLASPTILSAMLVKNL